MLSIRTSMLAAFVCVAGALAVAQETAVARSSVPPAESRAIEPPAKPVTPEMRGDILMARKMYREAIEVYKPLLLKNPVVHNKVGIAYHQSGDLENARKHYEQAVKLDPKYAEAINNLGTIHYARKSYRRAISQYQKALRLTPNSASIHSNLGTAYFARRNYKAASAAYQRALELDPEVFEHRNTAGVLLQERTVEERAKFYFYMAKTYAKAGVQDRALIYIRKALEEGFREKTKFVEDADFASLQELPEFKELMTRQTRVL